MDKEKYFKIRKRYIPTVWPAYTYWKDTRNETGIDCNILHVWEEDSMYTGIIEKDGFGKRAKYIYDFIIKNYKDDMSSLRDLGKPYANKLVIGSKKFSTDSKTFASIQEYIDRYDEVDQLYIDYYQKNMLLWLISDSVVVNKINEYLEGYSAEEKNEIWETMKIPQVESFSNIEERDFNELLITAKVKGVDSPEFEVQLKDFSEKYIWFPFEYGGPEIYDPESVKKRVLSELNQNIKTEESHSVLKIKKEQLDCVKKYSLNDNVVLHFNLLQTLILMQDDRKAVNSEVCYYINNIVLDNLSELIRVPKEDLYLVDKFLLQKYKNNIDDLKESIEKRKEMFVIHLKDDDSYKFVEGNKDCIKYLDDMGISLNSSENSNTEIKGRTAFKGNVKGRAKLVKKSSECEDMDDGDVLITYMTTPDFVPYIRKASAIVTEEGGITCHAAIVARELKRPCITGASNVMSQIKDGEMVEVDADNGIIKVIS